MKKTEKNKHLIQLYCSKRTSIYQKYLQQRNFLEIIILLGKYFNRSTTLKNDDDQQILKEFFTVDLNDEFEDISELRDAIDDFKVI